MSYIFKSSLLAVLKKIKNKKADITVNIFFSHFFSFLVNSLYFHHFFLKKTLHTLCSNCIFRVFLSND